TNSFSCTDTDEIFIELLEAPVIEFILPEIICSDVEAFELTATPSGGTYSGDGISDNIFDPLTAGLGNHIITYTFTDVNGCTSVSSQEIEVTICQAIDNIINNVTINIFPNPAISDITISISNAEEVERIEIFDLLGNKLISEQVNGIAEMELFYDISDIPSGTYLIYLKGNSEFYSRSFIISR
nr:T9SS type A sorting domain-containing protein [Chitinophagales bacterium]